MCRQQAAQLGDGFVAPKQRRALKWWCPRALTTPFVCLEVPYFGRMRQGRPNLIIRENPDLSAHRGAIRVIRDLADARTTVFLRRPAGPAELNSQQIEDIPMNTFFSMTPNHLRLALAVLSLVALVLGGSAGARWT